MPGAQNLRSNLPEQMSDITALWYKKMRQLGILNNCSMILSEVPVENPTDVYTSFSLRSGIYKYDAEILEPYKVKFIQRINEINRTGTIKSDEQKAAEEAVKTKKSELEEYFDSLDKSGQAGLTQAIVQLTFARTKKDEIDSEFKQMSEAGRQKYRQLLGR
jgi:hypothetical protein